MKRPGIGVSALIGGATTMVALFIAGSIGQALDLTPASWAGIALVLGMGALGWVGSMGIIWGLNALADDPEPATPKGAEPCSCGNRADESKSHCGSYCVRRPLA